MDPRQERLEEVSIAEAAAELAAGCHGSKEVQRALTRLARKGRSKLGRFSTAMEENHATALGTQPGPANNLLPMDPAAAEQLFQEWLFLVDAEFRESLAETSLGVILGLNFYACAGFAGTPVDAFASKVLSRAQRESCRKIFWDCKICLEVPTRSFDFKEERKELLQRRTTYGAESVSVREELEADRTVPAWPKEGEACVVDVVDHVDQHLKDDLLDPARCILPESEWPKETPKSKVHASEAEWYKLCQAAARRGMFEPVAEDKIFRNQFGDKVLNGAMGVKKVKIVDGQEIRLQRFICILTPINAYM